MVEIQVGDWVRYGRYQGKYNRIGEGYAEGKVKHLGSTATWTDPAGVHLLHGGRYLADHLRTGQTDLFAPFAMRGIIEVWRRETRRVRTRDFGVITVEDWQQVYDGSRHLAQSEGVGL